MPTFKKFLSDIYKYNKTLVYVTLSIFIVIIIGFIVVFSNNNSDTSVVNNDSEEQKVTIEKLYLFGNKEITLEQGEKYVEPGFYALASTGELKTDDVIVTPDELDTSIPGEYYINYVILNKKEQRKVIVLKREETGILSLELNGNSMIVLEVGDEYVEPGFNASDTIDGDLNDNVTITGEVDTNTPGTYTITYEVENSSGDKLTKTRTVIVNDSKIDINITTNLSSDYTNKDVVATINITGNNFSYIKFPNGTVSQNKTSTYTIKENGYYKFYIYDNNYNYTVKELNVTKIDKTSPTGTCTLIVNNGKSTIEVEKADDNLSGLKSYQIYANNNVVSNTSNRLFTSNTSYTSAYVNIYDNAGNVGKINCSYKKIDSQNVTPTPAPSPSPVTPVTPKYDYLEMHFIVSGYNDDAILIRTGEATILIDSGRKGAEKLVIPYLQGLGVKTIDALIGSHPHYNHIQAQAYAIENFTVKNSYYTVDLNTCASKNYCDSVDVKYILDAIKKYKIPMNITSPGDVIKIGDMTLYFIGPYKLNNTSKYKQNNNSGLFILKYKNNTFMFTGDADVDTFNLSKVKPYAEKIGISLNVDMLKYPHHGNANLDQALVNAMTPSYVVVPNYKYASKFNSSGKSKIKKIGAKIYELASDGNVVLTSDGNNITIKTKQSAATYKR